MQCRILAIYNAFCEAVEVALVVITKSFFAKNEFNPVVNRFFPVRDKIFPVPKQTGRGENQTGRGFILVTRGEN